MESQGELSEIQHFYKNKTIFLTGAREFVGKLVLEKILRCLHTKHVYVLERASKRMNIEELREEIFGSPAFGPLKRNDQQFHVKVSFIDGDCELPGLGLSQEDRNVIINEVDCIFHCGAVTELDESLTRAIKNNVRSTSALLDIARKIKNIKTFVFLSTVFSGFLKAEINEKIYDFGISPDKYIELVNSEKSALTKVTDNYFLGDWPDSYIFTMNLAENLLNVKGRGLPISIVRPSHLLPTAEEPLTGFVDTTRGISGYAANYALGLNRVNYYKDVNLNLIPVDYVVSSIIASGWYAGLQKLRKNREDIPHSDVDIYHCVSSEDAPVTTGEFFDIVHTVTREVPTSKMIQLPIQLNTTCWYNYKLLTMVLHYFMALMCDVCLAFLGKVGSGRVIYGKLHKHQEYLHHYFIKQWYISNEKTQKLLKRMSFRDRQLFNFDVNELNWQNYFVNFARGIRVYVLQDPLSTLTQAKKLQSWKLKTQLMSVAIFVTILYAIFKVLFVIISKCI